MVVLKLSEVGKQMLFDEEYVRGLEQKIQMMTTFINNSEAGMYVTDFYTCEILYANRKMVTFSGKQLSVDDLIGRTCWERINIGGEGRCVFCPYNKLLSNTGAPIEPYTWEHYFSKYGLWLRIISQAITWTDGRLAQMNTFYDITENKVMQEQIAEHIRKEEQWKMQQSLETLFDSLPVPVRISDIDSASVIYINSKCLELFNYTSPDEMIGQKTASFMPPVLNDGMDSHAKVREILSNKGSSVNDVEYKTATGRVFSARLTTCVINLNGKKVSLGIIMDLSAEQDQKRLLTLAVEREYEANQLKSSFLSNMSHEIRTPMNAIIGLTEIELRKDHQRETLGVYKKINNAAKNLLQIINDILDLSKIEANKMELYPVEFELEDVLNSALMVASSRLEGRKVELILDLSLDLQNKMFGDKTRLWQILRNILDNAVKFTTKGSVVLKITEESASSTDETVSISFAVADTGNGMTEEQLIKAFMPYEQMFNDSNVRHAGSGLGLPIAKQLCELMGGTLEAESTQGMGTIMRFTIPFARSQNSESDNLPFRSDCLSGVSILAVDDSELLAKTVQAMLQRCGAECVIAHSGEEALETIRKRNDENTPFDIIVLDYLMEGINGLETAKMIRKSYSTCSKIMIVTAYENLINKSDLIQYGIDDIIEKPFIPSHFIIKVLELANRSFHADKNRLESLSRYVNTRVLICEDIVTNQEVIAAMLEAFGIESIMAENGKIGVELLDSGEIVDMILMDLHMPVMDGYAAAQFIRSNPKHNAIPIISLTADAMSETIKKCLSVGMDDVITKPIEYNELSKALYKWLPEAKRIT